MDIDTDIDNYDDDELLQILELEDPTAEAIRDKVGVMMRQYPSIAFFFCTSRRTARRNVCNQ